MLDDGDLTRFLSAFEARDLPGVDPRPPAEVLPSEDGLFPAEFGRLVSSLQIASVLGDVPRLAAVAARLILNEIEAQRCAPLSDHDAWSQAIAWAVEQPAFSDPAALASSLLRDRETIVGEACLRLRKRGFRIDVGAYGPRIDGNARREIVRSVEGYTGLLGGLDTANQILRAMRDANNLHDGMWLFGEVGLGLYAAKHPMIPVGWLMSLALRNLEKKGTARKPAVAWATLIELATDFAAVHDCQRYSSFEDMDLHPSQLHRTLAASTLWREFSTLPQMPAQAMRKVLDALVGVLTEDDALRLGFAPSALVSEITKLSEWSAEDRATTFPRADVERALPLLTRLTKGAAERVNSGYSDPLAADGRTQDSVLLFACGRDQAMTLPRSFLAEAACEFVFGLLWSKLGSDAADVVGQTMERAIERACRGKASTVLSSHTYEVRGQRFECDAATRHEDRIALIETKGKMLTRQSRSGDMFAFFRDYNDSFLRMLSQLVRHEINLRAGDTPLTSPGEVVGDLRPVKMAVSPLSYGPVSDKALSSTVIRSLVGAKLTVVVPDRENERIIADFNKRTAQLLDDIAKVAPKRDGLAHLIPYLIDVFWLDLGQLLYVLDRADTVWDALRPLKHITFGSRDFWTELAHAERGGLTAGKWRPVTFISGNAARRVPQ